MQKIAKPISDVKCALHYLFVYHITHSRWNDQCHE